MQELLTRLNQISDSYDDFIAGVVHYAKADDKHIKLLLEFLDTHKDVSSSETIKFISDQPDFFENAYSNESKVS